MRYLFLIPLALIMFSMTAFATQYNISPSDDVYVNEHNPTSNYNSQTSLKVSNNSGTNQNSFIRFNLSTYNISNASNKMCTEQLAIPCVCSPFIQYFRTKKDASATAALLASLNNSHSGVHNQK